MTGEPQRKSPAGDGDSWESLAKDLFGIDFDPVPSGEEIPLPDDPNEAESASARDDEVPLDIVAETFEETTLEEVADVEFEDDDSDDEADDVLATDESADEETADEEAAAPA